MLDLRFGSGSAAVSAPAPAKPSVSGPPVSPARTVSQVTPGGSERVALYAAVVAVLVATAAGLAASYFQAQEQGRFESRTAQVAELVTQLSTGELGATQARLSEIDRQLSTYTKLESGGAPWASLLDAFADRIPGEVTLTATTFGEDATLRLEGTAGQYDHVARLMAALEDHEVFAGVSLVSATRIEQASGTSVTFSLTASYTPDSTTRAEVPTNG